MTGQTRSESHANRDPAKYRLISGSYLKAFRSVWTSEFATETPSDWDYSLVFHPISQLLGVALETALKGLLFRRRIEKFGNESLSHSHNLELLLEALQDKDLEAHCDEVLKHLYVPDYLFSSNPEQDPAEITAMFRRHHIHVHLLTKIYGKPFASRYPAKGGLPPFEPVAIDAIVQVIQFTLDKELQ